MNQKQVYLARQLRPKRPILPSPQPSQEKRRARPLENPFCSTSPPVASSGKPRLLPQRPRRKVTDLLLMLPLRKDWVCLVMKKILVVVVVVLVVILRKVIFFFFFFFLGNFWLLKRKIIFMRIFFGIFYDFS